MSGYVASARIIRGAPRITRPSDRVADRWTEPLRAATPDVLILDVDASPAIGGATVVERLHAIHERWSQLTFFLFDPNSWR